MSTPYALVTSVQRPLEGDTDELVRVCRRMERAALDDPPAVVAAALQDARHLTPRTRAVYEALAVAGSTVYLHARGLQSWVAPGVVGVALDDDDPLVDEWVVVLPSRTRPAVLAATDVRPADDDRCLRRLAYAVSHDPDVVEACAGLLVPDRAAAP